ncbi:MAG: molybdate ABC transporter substrate-binding protein, partial [Burkholderiales bacterium]
VSPWGNVLVVAVPAGIPLELRDITEITSSKVSSLMIGDPGTAPFGRYAKQALESAGLWEQVQNKVTTRKNIDLLVDALAEAESGTVGILFKSNMNERLREVAAVKASLHPPIRYYLAPLDASAARADIQKFLKFLTGPLGKAVFRAQNFDVNP